MQNVLYSLRSEKKEKEFSALLADDKLYDGSVHIWGESMLAWMKMSF